MKPYLTLSLALSLLGTVLSDPVPYDDFATSEFDDRAEMSQLPQEYNDQPDVQFYGDTQGQPGYFGNPHEFDAYQPDTESYADTQGEGEIKLPEEDIEELKKRPQEVEELAEAEIFKWFSRSKKSVKHGSTVMIQFDKSSYLRCPRSGFGRCSTSQCPGMAVKSNDWNRCGENVFQIYHSTKPGVIRVGDYIALYLPAARKWFSMYTNKGHLQRQCPGLPNKIYGFHREDSWQHCGSEVFRIYTEGKRNGQIIKDEDTITLYYPAGRQYLKLGAGTPTLHSCPGKCPPSNPNTYDVCVGEVFNIILK